MKNIKINFFSFLLIISIGFPNIFANNSRSNAHIVAHDYELSGDGILQSGETADMSLTITNTGTEATTGSILVVLTSSNPKLTILQDSAIYNGVAPGQFLTLQNGFTIQAATTVNNGQSFPITVTAICGDEVWESEITVTVYKPIVEFHGFTWSGDYVSGGTIFVVVSFENIGGIMTTNSILSLSTTTSNVTINNPEVNIGNLAGGGIGTVAFSLQIGTIVPLKIELSTTFSSNEGFSITEDFFIANGCKVILDLHDEFGDGWNGASLNLTFSNGWAPQSYTLTSGSSNATYSIDLISNITVTVTWIAGSWDYECSFEIYYEDGEMIYESSGTPTAGVITTFTTDCGTEPAECDAITNLSVETEETNVFLNWNPAPSGLYQIRRNGILIATEIGTSYTDINVAHGEHYYCVTAVCNDILANPICEAVTIYAPCSHPENVLAAIYNNYTAYISWSLVEGATQYYIYRNNDSIGTTTKSSYYDMNLEVGNYCYNVASVCINGVSGMSDEACLDIVNPECDAPSNLNANVDAMNIHLSWTSVASAESYNIYREDEQIATGIIGTNFTDENLNIGEYCYTVTSVCSNEEESSHSNNACGEITSIEEFLSEYNIFPNPAQSTVTIKGKNIKTITLYNTFGQIVKTISVSNKSPQLDVQAYEAGVYLLKITTQSGFETIHKIIISK